MAGFSTTRCFRLRCSISVASRESGNFHLLYPFPALTLDYEMKHMPIPYRDSDALDELGAVGYLKIEPVTDGSGYLGALFLLNARGEPLEFTYNRIDTPNTFLWRQDDLRRHAARKLTASLFSLCPRTPRLLLCLAKEIGSELFIQDIQVSIPVCRLAPAS